LREALAGAGRLGVIPLPKRAAERWTGRNAGLPDDEQTSEWADDPAYEDGNIGWHLGRPVDVDGTECEIAGIDVDHYDDNGKAKVGGDQLAHWRDNWVRSPPTWASTA
jgi:hypothetical protein